MSRWTNGIKRRHSITKKKWNKRRGGAPDKKNEKSSAPLDDEFDGHEGWDVNSDADFLDGVNFDQDDSSPSQHNFDDMPNASDEDASLDQSLRNSNPSDYGNFNIWGNDSDSNSVSPSKKTKKTNKNSTNRFISTATGTTGGPSVVLPPPARRREGVGARASSSTNPTGHPKARRNGEGFGARASSSTNPPGPPGPPGQGPPGQNESDSDSDSDSSEDFYVPKERKVTMHTPAEAAKLREQETLIENAIQTSSEVQCALLKWQKRRDKAIARTARQESTSYRAPIAQKQIKDMTFEERAANRIRRRGLSADARDDEDRENARIYRETRRSNEPRPGSSTTRKTSTRSAGPTLTERKTWSAEKQRDFLDKRKETRALTRRSETVNQRTARELKAHLALIRRQEKKREQHESTDEEE